MRWFLRYTKRLPFANSRKLFPRSNIASNRLLMTRENWRISAFSTQSSIHQEILVIQDLSKPNFLKHELMVFAKSLYRFQNNSLCFSFFSLQAHTVSSVIILHSHRHGSGDGGNKTGPDEKLLRRVFNPLPCFAMLRKPFWRSSSCGGVLYIRSGTTYALERLLDRRKSSYTGINAQASVLRLNQLHCVFRLCRQAAEPVLQKYSI